MTKTPDRWSTFDLAEAFHLSHAVAALHQIGVFAALKKPLSVKQLAAKYSMDAELLGGLLEYVAARTDLLRRSGDQFFSQSSYSPGSRFLLDLYVGTYGRNAAQIERLLCDPSRRAKLIDCASYALAFNELDDAAAGFLRDIIRQLGLNHLLDLGCGSGALLLALAKADSTFIGWGVDSNFAMCRATRAKIRAAGLQERLRVIHGDCRKLGSALPGNVTESVAAITACNVANEMF